ncbi:acetate regulatory DNA binding protein [Fusarium sp. NRRL 52700]|nr:acetate regulatory DNA binding protein [Fusarium sp. NRRL 52700]
MESSSRQQVGMACEECRRRKSKCDGEQPCGLCLEFRAECHFEGTRSKRGPKKGQLDALKARIAFLELQLSSKLQADHVNITNTDITVGPPINTADWTMPIDVSEAGWSETRETASETVDQAGWQDDRILSQLQRTFIEPGESHIAALQDEKPATEIQDTVELSLLMKLDLDQLYFDRVHPMIPMIHRGHYFIWSKLDDVPLPQKCLRWAMRALAASMSSQFRSFSEKFYNKARRLAEDVDAGDTWLNFNTSIEQAQIWLLLAHYELLDPSKYSQSATTGRAFQLVHLLRLHCTDWKDPALDYPSCPPRTSQSASLPFGFLEERRRTFWVAFCLDRFLSVYQDLPMAIADETIHVNLPCPEWNFLTSSELHMGFMGDVLGGGMPVPASSPFAKLVVAMGLFGQCLLHKQTTAKYPSSIHEVLTFWAQHEWLAKAIDKQAPLLSLRETDVDYESLHFLTSMVVHDSVLTLENAIDLAHSLIQSQQPVADNHARTAYKAAMSITDLSESITSSNYFKV